jgi:glucose 1-dehydrogenase
MFENAITTNTIPTTTADKPLTGQVALVTGGTSGIGRGVALSLAAAGADVVVNYIGEPASADGTLAELRERGVRALAVQADVSDEAQVEALFERSVQAFGAVDIVVANAGIQRDATIDKMTLADWRSVIDVNLTGQFLCARAAVRAFKRQGLRGVSKAAGKIVCMSSVHDTIPWAGHANYAASKGGVMMLMKTLAQELAAHRIRVNSICPGAIRTPINRAVWENAEAYAGLQRLIPQRRMGEPEEIGEVVAFLVSDRADYITGLNLYVDGGMLLYPGFEAGG